MGLGEILGDPGARPPVPVLDANADMPPADALEAGVPGELSGGPREVVGASDQPDAALVAPPAVAGDARHDEHAADRGNIRFGLEYGELVRDAAGAREIGIADSSGWHLVSLRSARAVGVRPRLAGVGSHRRGAAGRMH